MAPPGPTNSPEGLSPAVPVKGSVATSQTSSYDEKSPAVGAMPADYAGLEVAPNGYDGPEHYQQPAQGAPAFYAPYQDNTKPAESPYVQQQQVYPQSAVSPATHGGDYGGAPPPTGEKRIWGVRASTFWVALTALVFFLGTIGASAAAGTIAQQYAGYVQTCETKLEASSGQSSVSSAVSAATASASASASASGTASETPTSASASTTPTAFTSIPLPQQASSINGEATSNCPNLSSTNKTYTPPGSDLKFIRECGNNYPFNDLGKIPMTRMEDCINLCAALYATIQSSDGKCIGVAWVTAGKQGTDENYCWLKAVKGGADPKANVEAAWLQ
ncbi:hypothetical protein CMUS01_16653, partial [Colletotrichum musicola]